MYARGLMSPMQRCFSDLVCQPLVTSYVIDASLFGHVARLDHTIPTGALRLMVDTYEGRKPSQLEKTTGSSSQRLSQQVQEDANALLLSTLWRSEIAMGHGAAQLSLGLRDDDDDDDDEGCKTCVKMEGKTNFSRHLQAVRHRDC